MALDLDLLRTFVTIYERKSLTLAAADLNVTQPTVSYALSQLRSVLDDPLFSRTRQGMSPSARARELYAAARELIPRIDALADPAGFDPLTSRSRFRIALTDMGESVFLPPLMERLATEAPLVSVDVIPLDIRTAAEALRHGDLDAAITSAPLPGPRAAETLFDERYVCLGHWSDNERGRLTTDELARLRFAAIDPSTGHTGPDAATESIAGLNIVLSLQHVATLPEALRRGNLAAVIPRRIAEIFATRWDLSCRELPEGFPSSQVLLYSAAAAGGPISPSRQWFLTTIRSAVHEFAP